MTRFLGLLIMVTGTLLCATHTATAAETRVIQLQHRMPDEVLPALRPLLEPGESISGFDTKLILHAEPASNARIDEVLREIDVARRNLRISVRNDLAATTARQNLGATGEINSGNTRIKISNNNGRPDTASIGVDGRNSVQVHAERSVATRRDHSGQTLTVLDGARAFLRVGESIPYVQSYLALAGGRLGVVTGVQFYDVTTGFEVEPRVVGSRIQLRVAPRLAFRSSQGERTADFRDLHTTVTVTPGEWVDLGRLVESANEINRQILSSQQHSHASESGFYIRVDTQ